MEAGGGRGHVPAIADLPGALQNAAARPLDRTLIPSFFLHLFISIGSAPERLHPHAVVDVAATGLPSSRQEVKENRRGLLYLPRALNRARTARTLAIDLVFNVYITGVRRRLSSLRSTSGLPDLAFVLTTPRPMMPR
ncbi:uncharacterized protein LOC125553727 [Triticum urartu]|uniref:uncharacterized protein LOC125532482 n=1 Tax=Triticum urartu TaxID=4572 RepID=UPI002043B11B|nr:uncharacterized protein LOC125532482 [Triticum urartu]XP_048573414.1 uncharacterized protein LOC125553727 [Triticum urartu]